MEIDNMPPTDEEYNKEEPNEEEQHHFQVFRKAVDERDEGMINLLIRKEGILQKDFSVDERTFLHVVAQRGTIETIIEICKLESNVNIKGNFDETPIFCAIKHSAEMVNILAENGADVNCRNENNETPLHYAIRHSAEIVKVLLQNEAKVDITDDNGVTLLHEALLSGTEETVRLILNKILSKIRNNHKELKKTEEIVTVLLKNKENLKLLDKDCPLLIFFAAKIGNDDIFKLMMDEIRKSLNMVKKTAKRIIWTRSCDLERKYLIRLREDLNLRGYYDRTALHYAIREQLPEVVCFLLKAGADSNCRTRNNFTPLHYAASLQNEEICKILLSFGADVNYMAMGLGSPIYQVCVTSSISRHLKSTNGYYYLEDYDHTNSTARVFNPKITKLLIRSGANPNLPGDKGKPPLLEACIAGRFEVLKFLFELGASVRIWDVQYNSALHYAVLGNSLEIVNFLLEKGLNVDVKNNDCCTPLLLLMENRPELSEMTEYLVDRGADINARNENMMTPLFIASTIFESMESVENLLRLGADWKLDQKIDLLYNGDLPNFGSARKTLISFIALYEEKLENCIKYYFEHKMEELPEAFKYFEQSRLEVEKLKARKIVEERSVSFYDFLTGSLYNTVQVAKNDEIKKVFRSREYFSEFSCYWFLIEKRYERALALTEIVDKVAHLLCNCLSTLPMLAICKILNLLSSADYRKFERNWSRSDARIEQEPDSNLVFNRIYNLSKIVEIQETGVMISLQPNMPPALLFNSQLKTHSVPHPSVLNLKVGGNIQVVYQGRYPESGRIRLTAKLI